jgi:F-type H+-transporting ATPase subunit gamma
MATLKELKNRIGSVSSSEKITGAMKMISSAKVRKSETELKRLSPFKTQIKTIMAHLLSAGENYSSPLTEIKDVKKIGLVVFGSDDGLCGAYNVNIFKYLLSQIKGLRKEYGDGVELCL